MDKKYVLLHMRQGPSPKLRGATLRPRERLWQLYGGVKSFIYTFTAHSSSSILTTSHSSLYLQSQSKAKPPPRIERWALRIQPYRFAVIHMPGKTNPADVLSRLPLGAQSPRERNIAEEYIHFITQKAVPKSMTLEQISKATNEDATLQQVQQCLLHNQWSTSPDIQPFSRVRNELSTSES